MNSRPGVAVIFDLDGVILDSCQFHRVILKETYRRNFNCILTDEMLKNGHGRPLDQSVEIWNATLSLTVSFDEWYKCLKGLQRDYDHLLFGGGLAPDLIELLNYLDRESVPRAVVTSNHRDEVNYRLNKLDLWQWFNPCHIVTRDDVIYHKPHPEGILMAAERLGVEPERCIVIGDSIVDILAGRAAGSRTIAFTRYVQPFQLTELLHSRPHFITDAFDTISLPRLRQLVNLHPTAW